MQNFEGLLLLCSLLVSTTSALPRPQQQPLVDELVHDLKSEQKPLGIPHDRPANHHSDSNSRFDARQNSVGVLFTTSESEESVIHFWLPIGKKVFTRKILPVRVLDAFTAYLGAGDSPLLPLHPTTARITSLINTTPSLAQPEQLDRIQCEIWTATNRTAGRGDGVPEKWKISFTRRDELVKLASVDHGRFWLGGKEVESYECRA